jgi:hypothetical protein
MQNVHVKVNLAFPWQRQHSTRRRIRRKNTLCTTKLGLNLRKKPLKCYIWSVALFGADTWTLRKVDQKCLESFQIWRRERMEISWTDCVKNKEVLHRAKETRSVLPAYKKRRKTNWIGDMLGRNCLLKYYVEGRIEGTRRRERRRKQPLNALKEKRSYW